MKLTVREISKLLKVSEKIVYDWINKEELPAYKVNDQYRINQTDLMEWAASRKISLPTTMVRYKKEAPMGLVQALEKGGIVYGIQGDTKEKVLNAVVQILKLPKEMDRKNLFQILLAREALASTGIGKGIALPHVRNPIVLPLLHPTLTLCFLQKPVDFGSLDGIPVHTLFIILSPTIHLHLQMISHLSFALFNENFKTLIENRGEREAILNNLRDIENHLGTPAKGNS